MASRLAFLLLLLAVALVAESPAIIDAAASDAEWELTRVEDDDGDAGLEFSTPICLSGDCLDEDNEMDMESDDDDARRILALRGGRKRYISYDALQRDRVPCNRRGQSYYNCRRSGRANPYRRGCSIITRCARILN